LALKKYYLWEIVDKVVVLPTDLLALVAHEKEEIKFEWVILDLVKDHLIPRLSKRKTTKDVFDALVGLFQSSNMNRKMILGNKIIYVHMSRFDNVTSHFMRITHAHDQLAAIGEKLDGIELIDVTLNDFPKSWEPFLKGFCTKENLIDWKRLWDDFIPEETREESKSRKQ
jgi:hypothetical protein